MILLAASAAFFVGSARYSYNVSKKNQQYVDGILNDASRQLTAGHTLETYVASMSEPTGFNSFKAALEAHGI